jgi:DNA-binding CsgD family transcriptional regulator
VNQSASKMWTSAAQLEIGGLAWQRPKELHPAPSSLELLRALAVAGDATSTGAVRLERVWAELVRGECRVVDTFFAANRSFLLSRESRSSGGKKGARRVPRRALELLETVLLGSTQKAVAIEAGMSVSTVSTLLREVLAVLGLSCSASKVPPILVALATAARVAPLTGRECTVTDGVLRYRVVSFERPDLALSSRLSPAEYEATRLLVEGKHHDEIARERNSSPRTIANQLGSAFRKLGVSGRSELLAALFRDDASSIARSDFTAAPPPA